MICERCGKETNDTLHSLGNCYTKSGESLVKVCDACCRAWIFFLDSEVSKQKILLENMDYLDLAENVKEIVWLNAFKLWKKTFKVRFVFR